MNYSKAELIVLPIALVIIVGITIILYYLLRNKNENIRRIPLIIISVILLVLELIKQIINVVEGYSKWAIPLHFCSLFLYFYPLASFFKGKVGEFGKTMSFVCASLFILLFYINPTSIIGGSCQNIFADFGTFHTFTYHHLIILFYLIMLTQKLFKPDKFCYLYAIIGLSIYALVAIPAANILDINFCNLLHSNIPFMESLRGMAGQVIYLIVMYAFAVGVSCITLCFTRLISKIKRGVQK